jgi:hypothetical protein
MTTIGVGRQQIQLQLQSWLVLIILINSLYLQGAALRPVT